MEPATVDVAGNSAKEAALPGESANTKYKLILIDLGELPSKIYRTNQSHIFDGYSPRLEFMMQDAMHNIDEADNTLSPHSMTLFDDVGLCSIDMNTDASLGIYHASALTPYKGQKKQPLPAPVQALRKRGRPQNK